MEMQKYRLDVSESGEALHQDIMIVAERDGLSASGNPVHLISVFMYNGEQGYGHQWSPQLSGYRERKDGKFRIEGHQRSKLHMMRDFRNELQKYLDEDKQ